MPSSSGTCFCVWLPEAAGTISMLSSQMAPTRSGVWRISTLPPIFTSSSVDAVQLIIALAWSIGTSETPVTAAGGAVLPKTLNVSLAGSTDVRSAALTL